MPLEFLRENRSSCSYWPFEACTQRVDSASMASWGVEQRSGARAGALAWHSTHDSRVNELFTPKSLTMNTRRYDTVGPSSELLACTREVRAR